MSPDALQFQNGIRHLVLRLEIISNFLPILVTHRVSHEQALPPELGSIYKQFSELFSKIYMLTFFFKSKSNHIMLLRIQTIMEYYCLSIHSVVLPNILDKVMIMTVGIKYSPFLLSC